MVSCRAPLTLMFMISLNNPLNRQSFLERLKAVIASSSDGEQAGGEKGGKSRSYCRGGWIPGGLKKVKSIGWRGEDRLVC